MAEKLSVGYIGPVAQVMSVRVRIHRLTALGMGIMGSAMAGRLIDAGYAVTVWNRSKEKCEPLAKKGAKAIRGFPVILGAKTTAKTVAGGEYLASIPIGRIPRYTIPIGSIHS